MTEYAELLKYLIGAIPPLIVMLWKWHKERQKDTVIDGKQFLKELQEMHDEVLAHKEKVIRLTIKNEQLESLKISLNGTIKKLKAIISRYKAQFGEIED